MGLLRIEATVSCIIMFDKLDKKKQTSASRLVGGTCFKNHQYINSTKNPFYSAKF